MQQSLFEIATSPNKTAMLQQNSGSEFLLIVKAALQVAFEAGQWAGQVDLEEHYDRSQFSEALIEAAYSRKRSMPMKEASPGSDATHFCDCGEVDYDEVYKSSRI